MDKMRKKPELNTGFRIPRYWYYLAVIGVFLSLYIFQGRNKAMEISWLELRDSMLLTQDVEKIEVHNGETAEIYLRAASLNKSKFKDITPGLLSATKKGPHYFFTIGSIDVFERRMDEVQAMVPEDYNVDVLYVNDTGIWKTLLYWFGPLFVLVFFWFLFFGKTDTSAGGIRGSLWDFGKSSPQIYEKGKYSPITFKDVAGYEEAKAEIMEIVEFLKTPENFTRLGAKIPKGILLVGAPGTGKTLLAKAVAGEAGVPFFSLSGSEFIEMFVGVGASRVRDLFNKAKQKAPSIIFIDEIDTIGRMRGKAVSIQANDERESTLNQLLAEMDGFDPNTGVIVMAATNRADILDAALLRPGRFDRHIHLDLPNKLERKAIFNVHLKSLLLDMSVDVDQLASQTPGFSGADISNICNEAALIAARSKKKLVEMKDFNAAIDRVVGGLEKKSKVITPGERKITAYHEAGHAVVSWMLKFVDPLLKVTIIPRGKTLGGAWYIPGERQIVTHQQFLDRICAALGGRVAEEVVFNEVSSGAMDDLERVTKQAYMMVVNLGFSEKIGPLSFYDSTGQYGNSFQKPYSEETGKLIDEEVRKLVLEAYDRAKNILLQNKTRLEAIAQLLLDKETVYKEDLEQVLGKRIVAE